MTNLKIDYIKLEIFSKLEEITSLAWLQISQAISEKLTEHELNARLGFILIVNAQNFTFWNKLKFKWWLFWSSQKAIFIPQDTQIGWQLLPSLKSTRITRLQYACANMEPATQFITDYLKSELPIFPQIEIEQKGFEAMNLDDIKLGQFIQLFNANQLHTESESNENLQKIAEIIYTINEKQSAQIPDTLLDLIHFNYVRWFNQFVSQFPLLFPKKSDKKQEESDDLFDDAEPKELDWRELITYNLPSTEFGLLEHRTETFTYNVFSFLNMEIERNPKKV